MRHIHSHVHQICSFINKRKQWLAINTPIYLHYCLSNLHLHPTVFTAPPSDLVIVEGVAARFDCGFTSTNPVSIVWRKAGSQILPSDKFQYLENNSLVIAPTESGDEGVYTCVVQDQMSGNTQERSASLSFACEEIPPF